MEASVGEPTSHSFIYLITAVFPWVYFKVIIMSLVMEDLGASVVTCGNIIYPHQMHMWSLSEETHVIS